MEELDPRSVQEEDPKVWEPRLVPEAKIKEASRHCPGQTQTLHPAELEVEAEVEVE